EQDKKRVAKPKHEESPSLDDLELENKSLTVERYFYHLRNNYKNSKHQTPIVEVKKVKKEAGPELTSTGETIRQSLDTEYGDQISLHYFESFQTLQNESCEDFGSEFVSCYPSEISVFKNRSSFSSMSNIRNQTKSLPIFSTKDKKLKINKSEPSRRPRAMDEKDFETFAKERLRMPSTVFVTPYPLHIMYRKLRKSATHSSHVDFGFYHPLILPENGTAVNSRVNSYHIFQNTLYSEKYGPDLDLRSVHPNDYQLDSTLSHQFQELLCMLINEYVSRESWVECYYCPSKTIPQVTRYIVDLPQYRLFIEPLFFNANSKISHFLSEYYKIVQNPF
ncbi:hypothetical protein LOTGIDRAFT_157880, partial [Lottia gigantea]